LRREIAREKHVPAYVVFPDTTLQQMALLAPKTREEMLGVSGVGDRKLELYGDRFLALLNGE
jgi:ATP-dependent DNA helicase RecQ